MKSAAYMRDRFPCLIDSVRDSSPTVGGSILARDLVHASVCVDPCVRDFEVVVLVKIFVKHLIQ